MLYYVKLFLDKKCYIDKLYKIKLIYFRENVIIVWQMIYNWLFGFAGVP